MARRDLREFKPGERWAELDLLRAEYPNFKPFIFGIGIDSARSGCPLSDDFNDVALLKGMFCHEFPRKARKPATGVLWPGIGNLELVGFFFCHSPDTFGPSP